MDGDTLDLIVRSRNTILEILEDRGYNVDAYKGVSPKALYDMITSKKDDASTIRIDAPKREGSDAPCPRAVVLYEYKTIRLQLDGRVNDYYTNRGIERNDDLIVVILDVFHDAFTEQAVRAWNESQSRLTFINVRNLISNPARHYMVPRHRKLSSAEISVLMKRLHLKSKSELQHIKFHQDMQARVHGLVPGDVVEITSPSESAGETVSYRVCSI
jgi:DNA-directed RNA polymerase subunit H (RpoH/RPB5)